MGEFAAIDFETATGYRSSACAVGIVVVQEGEVVDQFESLIRPPGNDYWSRMIGVHGITPRDTASAPTFEEVFPEIRRRLAGRQLVAHNEVFDRSVLKACMAHYGLDDRTLCLPIAWGCTLKLFRSLGHKPCDLHSCCARYNIPLQHHNALSDALGCALLWLKAHQDLQPA